MTTFVGTHPGKLDRKGRISVPATFRAELEVAGSPQLAFRVSHSFPCIEAQSRQAFQQMLEGIMRLDHFSRDRDVLEAGILADTVFLKMDGDNRLVLPEEMVAEAGIGENVVFLGKGARFEIWNAEAGRAHVAENKRLAREQRLTLSAVPLSPTPRGMP